MVYLAAFQEKHTARESYLCTKHPIQSPTGMPEEQFFWGFFYLWQLLIPWLRLQRVQVLLTPYG
jgi:hypothetical protein